MKIDAMSAQFDSPVTQLAGCALEGFGVMQLSQPFCIAIAGLSLDIEDLSNGPDDDGETFLDEVSDACEESLEGFDPENWWGDNCCCQVCDKIFQAGTPCPKFEAFFVIGSCEAAVQLSGLELQGWRVCG